MNYVKPRKPRGIKKDGTKSFDFCRGCYHPFCDPMALSPRVEAKISSRLHNGRCPACGKLLSFCSCKSGDVKAPVMRTHNNKKEREEETLRAQVSAAFTTVCQRSERRDEISDEILGNLYFVLHGLQSRRPNQVYMKEINTLKSLMKLTNIFYKEDMEVMGQALMFFCYESK